MTVLEVRRSRRIGDEERTDEVVELEVEGVAVDEEGFESIETAEPRREGTELVVAEGEGVKAGELGELRRKGGETARVGEEDTEGGKCAEERWESAGGEVVAVNVELLTAKLSSQSKSVLGEKTTYRKQQLAIALGISLNPQSPISRTTRP